MAFLTFSLSVFLIIHIRSKYRKFEHPEIETFGENLGEITTEIFGYDVGSTGFHTILKNVADRKNSYEKALNEFQGELGKEAKSITGEWVAIIATPFL